METRAFYDNQVIQSQKRLSAINEQIRLLRGDAQVERSRLIEAKEERKEAIQNNRIVEG